MQGERPSRNPLGIDRFDGLDNTSREDAIDGAGLRKAENVDIRSSGKVERRRGYTLLRSGSRVHSLTEFAGQGVWVENGALLRGDPPFNTATTVVASVTPGALMSYTHTDDWLYYSNGVDSGRLSASGTWEPWHITPPAGPPTVVASPGGGTLRAGRYQVTCLFLDDQGRESGAPGPVLVDLPSEGSLNLSNIPQPVDANIETIAIYCSEPDGTDVKWADDVPVGTTSASIEQLQLGEPIETLFCEPLPAGHLLAHVNGRLFVASGMHVWYSEPLNYGLCKIHENYWSYASKVTLLVPVGDAGGSGLYISDGKRTYWVSGADPEEAQQVVRYPHGAVEGTSITLSGADLGFEYAGPVAAWVATNGRVVAGLPNGTITPLNEKAILDPHERGAPLYREMDGLKQLIFAVRGKAGVSGFKAVDTAAAAIHSNKAANDGFILGDELVAIPSNAVGRVDGGYVGRVDGGYVKKVD